MFDGSGPYPPLRNLDVAAFFPFQEATHSFVFAAYVMTRDLTRVWQKPGPREYDMPPRSVPLHGRQRQRLPCQAQRARPAERSAVPVKRISCTKHTLTFQTELTDSPILIQATGA